ncbi:uncharacterized protein LOC128964493 [Oppia nitens]|uniref:uncharacterized protein LOC128964493 n=1 Tax=Oppia nitens TaxID=1686743 RepID=UPI0023DC6953|nr:uncharacterized protein LOC128964493 [Oppia nitens]
MSSDNSSVNNNNNGYYQRIQSLVTRFPSRFRWLSGRRRRQQRPDDQNMTSSTTTTTTNAMNVSDTESTARICRQPIDDSVTTDDNQRPPHLSSSSSSRRESTQSLFESQDDNNNSSQTTTPAQSPTTANGCGGRPTVSRPPHSHLYRHSSHYPLLFGSYNNNWSSVRDNRLLAHLHNGSSDYTAATNRLNSVDKERNVLSAIMSIVVIATLATALAQPKWFSITGGVCDRKYIGLQEYFYVTNFNNYHHLDKDKILQTFSKPKSLSDTRELSHILSTNPPPLLSSYDMNGGETFRNCLTPEIVALQRLIIGLCFFAIIFNLIQFFFDTLGVNRKWLNAVRSHALGNIVGVLLCAIIVGVAYLVSTLLEKEQYRLMMTIMKDQKHHKLSSSLSSSDGIPVVVLPTIRTIGTGGSSQEPVGQHHIEVKFELSYYLVTFSGLLAIIAAASNLLRRPQHYYIETSDAFWTDDIDEDFITSTGTSSSISTAVPNNWHPYHTSRPLMYPMPTPATHPSVSLPPPPPYTP